MPLDPVFAMAESDPVDGGNHLDQLTADVGTLPARRDLLAKLKSCFPT